MWKVVTVYEVIRSNDGAVYFLIYDYDDSTWVCESIDNFIPLGVQ